MSSVDHLQLVHLLTLGLWRGLQGAPPPAPSSREISEAVWRVTLTLTLTLTLILSRVTLTLTLTLTPTLTLTLILSLSARRVTGDALTQLRCYFVTSLLCYFAPLLLTAYY